MDNKKLKILYMKVMYLYGAIADLLIVLAYILYAITDFRIYLDLIGYPLPTLEIKVILTFAIGTMIGWTVMLFWGAMKPLKYKFTLLLIAGVMYFSIFSDFILLLQFNSVFPINAALNQIPIRAIMGSAFLLAYIIGYHLEKKVLITNRKNLQKNRIIFRNIKRITFLQIIFWISIFFCAIITCLTYLYIMKIDIGLSSLGFPSYSEENAIILYSSLGLMQFWMLLLLWASFRPIKRKSILLITTIGLLIPCVIYSTTLYIIYQLSPFIVFYIIIISLIIIQIYGYKSNK